MIHDSQIVIPGKTLGSIRDFDGGYISTCKYKCLLECFHFIGVGTYVKNNNVCSSLLGRIVLESVASNNKRRINVVSDKQNINMVISVGDEVLCQVTRILLTQINVDILVIGDKELRQISKGIIRKEDVRDKDIDKVIMSECFRVGDLVKAAVISLGDSKQYYLSSAAIHLGVCVARHEKSGRFLSPVSWKEMEDKVTKQRETRKVAKPT